MRTLTIKIPRGVLPELSRQLHPQLFKFSVEHTEHKETVIVTIDYQPEQSQEIDRIERAIPGMIKNYNEFLEILKELVFVLLYASYCNTVK